eukprot:TRINITY_DN1495_c0_g1_i1.p1 TRINITY_DN1495_c0_g1~~TRINITY_DN1495_c0_g1_i1.p1  ORF type:complete len:148 (-),score=17.59 TRINITY_DN1495_c0_g1_i1:13-456(-)
MKFSIDDLASKPNQTHHWDGVRNYQARNFLREMKAGDQCLFYHSSCKVPGVVGLCSVVREAYPDHTQFDAKHPHFDGFSDKADPKWSMVDVKLDRKFKNHAAMTLSQLKKHTPLQNMALFNRARLSVQPVTEAEFKYIVALEDGDAK